MRVMVMVKATKDSEAGSPRRTRELLEAMGNYNEELVKAGIMRRGDGLQAAFQGQARLRSTAASRSVIDGPFTETRELVRVTGSGRSRTGRGGRLGQALPQSDAGAERIEIRPLFELADFGEVVTPEAAATWKIASKPRSVGG